MRNSRFKAQNFVSAPCPQTGRAVAGLHFQCEPVHGPTKTVVGQFDRTQSMQRPLPAFVAQLPLIVLRPHLISVFVIVTAAFGIDGQLKLPLTWIAWGFA